MKLPTLTSRWKESLEFLRWGTVKQLLLATLKTFVQAIGLVIQNFWWLLISTLVLGALGVTYKNVEPLHKTFQYSMLIQLSMLSFYFLLATRTTRENKDFSYFFRNTTLAGIIILILPILLSYMLNYFGDSQIIFLLTSFLYNFMSYSIFFFLDSDLSLKSLLQSIKRSFMLIWFFLPGIILLKLIFLIFFFICTIIFSFPFTYFNLDPAILVSSSALAIVSLYVTLTSVLYTKIKHSHFSLFFE
jgi:hypothetical protein